MKITEKQLRNIIKESIQNVLVEYYDPNNLSSDDIDYITGNFHRRQRANSVKEEEAELHNDIQNRARKAFQETFNDLKINYEVALKGGYRDKEMFISFWTYDVYTHEDLLPILKIINERADTFNQNLVKNGLPCKDIEVCELRHSTDLYTQFVYIYLEITEEIEHYLRLRYIMADNEY